MKFSKEAIEEAAKLSKMSVGDYLDKLPSSFYEEAAKQSGFSNQEYLGKLKSIYSEPLKKKRRYTIWWHSFCEWYTKYFPIHIKFSITIEKRIYTDKQYWTKDI